MTSSGTSGRRMTVHRTGSLKTNPDVTKKKWEDRISIRKYVPVVFSKKRTVRWPM
jgi:hypothetical protein